MKTMVIPQDMLPFRVTINGVTYVYEAGTEQEVPDEVAEIIMNRKNDYPPRDREQEAPFDVNIPDISSKADKADVGNKADLTTTAKNTLVDAINEVNAKGAAVETSASGTVTLKNNVTTVITGEPTAVAVTLTAPSEGKEYITGAIFKAGSGITVTTTAPTGYTVVWEDEPTWTAEKVYEVLYRCLWIKKTGNTIISARAGEVS